ncbi:bifunctional RNase H/acid phosphatase [Holospora obtusa F1]|uniref:Bifunctional RNase H/acid phosphatase n=2 Tax=Holospora obtusa TaxID=49893 RepID=W6TFI0_HOLOB|nr:bifunctional RNase H/acid phosphatase [Holospora obtusa F1]
MSHERTTSQTFFISLDFEHRAMGSQNTLLNDRGVSQGLNAAELLKNEPIATIVSSPLRRARKTADIIVQHKRLLSSKLLRYKKHAEAKNKVNSKTTVYGLMVGETEQISKERKVTLTFHQELSQD